LITWTAKCTRINHASAAAHLIPAAQRMPVEDVIKLARLSPPVDQRHIVATAQTDSHALNGRRQLGGEYRLQARSLQGSRNGLPLTFTLAGDDVHLPGLEQIDQIGRTKPAAVKQPPGSTDQKVIEQLFQPFATTPTRTGERPGNMRVLRSITPSRPYLVVFSAILPIDTPQSKSTGPADCFPKQTV
jgi:hypothetical protein